MTDFKEFIFDNVESMLEELNFTIIKKDFSRPWGGFFVIDEAQASAFAKKYFPTEDINVLKLSNKLSPKILLVAPWKRLSWQYHHRRAEIWKCIDARVGVITSDTNVEGTIKILEEGDSIKLYQGQRHRLVGLDQWGIIAEIWLHMNENNPSDEDDIVRVQDDFGR